MESVVSMFAIAKDIGGWVGYLNGLEPNMQNLKRKINDLSDQKSDIEAEITSSEDMPRKRLKKQVEVWLRDVSRLKNDVQRLDQEVEEGSVFSRLRLGNRISTKIQEATKLEEKGKAFDGLQVDEPIGRLLMPPTEDFVETTEARNVERVWECLMNDEVRRVGVWGMGGVGKTTIMKHIHNKLLEETDKFDSVFWVTVSKEFNVRELQREIAKELKVCISDDEDVTRRAKELHAVLSRRERYVLILDDLWEAFPLGMVGIPEPTRSNGCKLVLTTRSFEVCRRMPCTPVRVELLTKEEALTLFLRKAIGNDTMLPPKLEEIATQVSKECARLPLAIVTVGGSLRGLKRIREWRNALNELINSTKDASDDESELTSSCLLESGPEKYGQEIVRMHDLIRDMALRITASSPRFMVNAGETKKKVPYQPWSDDLQRISFMYSLINELPITPPVCPRLTTLFLNISYESTLQVIPDSFFTNMPCLEVLNLSNSKITSLPESISNLENLHALILRGCNQLKNVPSLEKLKALKRFELTNSEIEELPEGIEELVNLRKLNLSFNFRLRTFPSWKLRRLSTLEYLIIDFTGVKVSTEDLLCLHQLKVVAVHFQNVKELTRYVISQQFQGLQKYHLIVGEGPEGRLSMGKKFSISYESVPLGSGVDQLVLPAGLESFRVDGFHDPISLSAIPWFKDAKDLRECFIHQCNGLESIFSSSTFLEDGQIPLGTVERVSLVRLPKLRVLFDEIAPPHNIYFNLKYLLISSCDTMKNIFPVQLLQNIPNLETLIVFWCKSVEDIIVEIAEVSDWGNHQDYSNSISLPKLKKLQLDELPRLKSIYNGVMVCPSIEEVYIEKSPMVRRLPLSLHMDGEQATPPPALKCIRAEKELWESLEWDDPVTKTILQPYAR
ncbi:hypothetical protein RHGRI_025955 [Rhododendron griersonianum]|uniref:AAA+ ATPase domain-containing protein n=1 Tax=Rhododendron griersonianum TaxID=479676 RepID=A0AAV6IX32_9ERIC|nr:hypothetical protein RHGRI_025955 [Rhododendron griersonianum]